MQKKLIMHDPQLYFNINVSVNQLTTETNLVTETDILTTKLG